MALSLDYRTPKYEEKKDFKNDTKVFSLSHWMGKFSILRSEGLEEKKVEVV